MVNILSSNSFDDSFDKNFLKEQYKVDDNFITTRIISNIFSTNTVVPTYNPLIIVAGTGMGKTYRARAITAAIRRCFPDLFSVYISSVDLLHQFKLTFRKRNPYDFAALFKSADILIVDDIHILKDNEALQSEISKIVEYLILNKKQIIFTSQIQLTDSASFTSNFKSMLVGRYTIVLQLPSTETRRQILLNHCNINNLIISEDVISFITNIEELNIRAMKGLLSSIVAYSVLNNQEITIELAKKIYTQFNHSKMTTVSEERFVKLIKLRIRKYFSLCKDVSQQ